MGGMGWCNDVGHWAHMCGAQEQAEEAEEGGEFVHALRGGLFLTALASTLPGGEQYEMDQNDAGGGEEGQLGM